jgi:hypothetical protein
MLTVHEKNELKQVIQANNNEVYLISMEEMDAIIRSNPNGGKPVVQEAWKEVKEKIELGVNYYSSGGDANTLAKLVRDLGGFGAKAYVKTYAGKPHIIIKGNPGLRRILTGTKYGINNPKVVTIGLGKAAGITAAKQGGVITIVLLTIYRVVDYFLTDQMTLNQLIGSLAVDLVKVGISVGFSLAAVAVVGGFTVAVGPILAVVIVGWGATALLNRLDTHLKITERVVAGLDELGHDVQSYIAQKNRQLGELIGNVIYTAIDYAIESAKAISVTYDTADRVLNQVVPPARRVR